MNTSETYTWCRRDQDKLLVTLMRRLIEASRGDLAVWDNHNIEEDEEWPFCLYVDETITITADELQQLIRMGATTTYKGDE